MLALVKKPHIELSLNGEGIEELIAWIKKKYDVAVISTFDQSQSVPVEETTYWQRMENNRAGNLLAGARLKAGLTQGQLAQKAKVRQNMISDYERGRRKITPAMAQRLSKILKTKKDYFLGG